MRRRAMSLAAAAVLAGGGCASVPRDAGFGDVRQAVAQRTQGAVDWNRADESADLQNRVTQILQRPLTVDSAVQVALWNDRHLQADFEDLGIAEADVVQAGLLKNPVLDLEVRFPDKSPSKTYLDIAATEDFLDLALLPARKRLAREQFEQAKLRVTADALRTAAHAALEFYELQCDQEKLEMHQTVCRALEAASVAAEAIHDAGNLTDLDLATYRTTAAMAEADLLSIQEAVDAARERLNDAMGLWSESLDWTVTQTLPPIPGEPPRLPQLVQIAAQRPDLAAARQEIIVQAQRLGLVREFRFVQDLELGPEFERETDGQWRIGPSATIPLPLFDQGQAAIAKARATLRQSEDRYYALAVDIRSHVRGALRQMIDAQRRASLYGERIVPLEKERMRQMQLQYNGMFVGVFALLSAKHEQLEATEKAIEARRDYWSARVDLELAIGRKLPETPVSPAGTRPSPAMSNLQEMSER